MNKIVISAGLLAVGVSGMNAANETGLTPQEKTKWWSVSASLRGFYDDNVLQTHKKEGSPGVEFNPTIGLNMPLEQTLISAKYSFLLNYFSDRPGDSTDHHHEFTGRVNHRFSERYVINIGESFIYSNEPELVDQGGTVTGFTRTDSSAYRNRIPIDLNMRLTPLIGVLVGYQNSFYDYVQDNSDLDSVQIINGVPTPVEGVGSRSALLDRTEHVFYAEGKAFLNESTTASLGYAFGFYDYRSDDLTRVVPQPEPGWMRSAYSHRVYVGAAHLFNQRLRGSGRVGMEYVDYFELNESDTSPYVDLTADYTYLPGSSVALGVKVEHAATDLVGAEADPTRDQLASSVYMTLTHKITPRITGQLYGRYQHSLFNGGEFDGETEGYLNSSVSLSYQIDYNIAASLAYSFDNLWSDLVFADTGSPLKRSFNRNRVWAGVTVAY